MPSLSPDQYTAYADKVVRLRLAQGHLTVPAKFDPKPICAKAAAAASDAAKASPSHWAAQNAIAASVDQQLTQYASPKAHPVVAKPEGPKPASEPKRSEPVAETPLAAEPDSVPAPADAASGASPGVDTLGLDDVIVAKLAENGIDTVDELVEAKRELGDLTRLEGIGSGRARQIDAALASVK